MKKQIMLFFISILVVTQNSRAASDHYCRYFATSFILTVPAMLYLCAVFSQLGRKLHI